MTRRLPGVTSRQPPPDRQELAVTFGSSPLAMLLPAWRVRTFFTGHRAYLGHTAAYNPASPSAYEIASTGRRHRGDAGRVTSASSPCACAAAGLVTADNGCGRAAGRDP